jgi:hypothetical protein
MEIIQLVGERMYLDYLITSTFNYNYQDSTIRLDYSSFLVLSDIEDKINTLQESLDSMAADEKADRLELEELTTAIQILADLKNRLTSI